MILVLQSTNTIYHTSFLLFILRGSKIRIGAPAFYSSMWTPLFIQNPPPTPTLFSPSSPFSELLFPSVWQNSLSFRYSECRLAAQWQEPVILSNPMPPFTAPLVPLPPPSLFFKTRFPCYALSPSSLHSQFRHSNKHKNQKNHHSINIPSTSDHSKASASRAFQSCLRPTSSR